MGARAGERNSAGPSAASAACSQIPPDRVDHLALMPGATTPYRVGRDVMVGKLIRIEIGTISREREEADLLGVTVHPVSDLRGPVHGVFVHDQEDSPPGVPEEPPQKREEHRGCETLSDHHKGQLSPVRDRRDQGAPTPAPCPGDRRSPPPPSPGPPCLVIGAHPCFLPPDNRRVGPPSLLPDPGVLLLQPPLDRLRIPLVRPPEGCLGGKSPAPQVAPHGPHGE